MELVGLEYVSGAVEKGLQVVAGGQMCLVLAGVLQWITVQAVVHDLCIVEQNYQNY